MRRMLWGSAAVLGLALLVPAGGAAAPTNDRAAAVAASWSAAARAAAIPRDFVVDERGVTYLRGSDGSLQRYGAPMTLKGKPGGGGTRAITNAVWTGDGAVSTATGRLYFRMRDANGAMSGWVCSGTAITDSMTGASLILTAAHCVYDDLYGEFANSVLFIPDHAVTTTPYGSNLCPENPLGCWTPSHGVVDDNWTSAVWPNNVAWDYGFYVVPVDGAHVGSGSVQSLEAAAGTLAADFTTAPSTGTYSYAFGYSYKYDPQLRYCAEGLGTTGTVNWWLGRCRLSGGASGGPWLQPFSAGSGTVVSVNSWGYNGAPGMAGPILSSATARCVRDTAESVQTPSNGGVIAGCAG